MNAQSIIALLARTFAEARLEAVMIGNAAAALQGSPVTTLDIDFMFRRTTANLAKLKQVARNLDAVILRPYYPASQLYRMVNDSRGIQLDFMPIVDGIRSFEGLRSRASTMEVDGHRLWVASLPDIIASKRAAGRPQDLAILPVLEKTWRETKTTGSQAPRGTRRASARNRPGPR